ncbi:LURP-one-related/scramblase family protein [Corynebacterium macginleyi]|uniref:hypothetical protein n=1 Tax=Corynebacterium macginleyi TaxID=38290 RepID=UPI001F3E101C|nr:hypothetical protein [Corynebacterium macginleyi]
MMQKLFTLDELVISQTKSLLKDRFMISDVNGTPVGTIVQSTSLKDMMFKPSRSLEVALTDTEGNPQQTVMTISDPPNFLRDTYEVHLPGIEQPMRLPSFSGHPISTDPVSVGEDVHCEFVKEEVHPGVPA